MTNRSNGKREHPTELCETCKGRGWYTVNGWPVVCTRCKVANPAARRKREREMQDKANKEA